ncbi:MAG: hypothetical protein M0R30_02220 [Methanoregula sp.]|jgi:hypothetical protein|uniref:hypothetical protein n=1 Tax=Methanoregula sp. TaxID=2052170 RepID=UPI0025F20679|nr:hypothetical protein [Methanoregula sp.]MCK9630432.1 hypothetical protein [Methanoregula sp.]
MFESELQTRAAICGAGLLLALIFLFAHLPLILMIVPVAILFLGPRIHQNPKAEKKPWGFFDCIVADPEETHAVWYGMLSVLGIFDLSTLTDAERLNYAEKRHYFWFGEVGMAAMLAGVFAVPLGIFLLSRAEITLAFTGAAIIFLPLFVFLPKLIQRAMRADADAIIIAFGKNEQVKKVFWSLFISMAGLVLARVVDPVTTQQIVGLITGMGG